MSTLLLIALLGASGDVNAIVRTNAAQLTAGEKTKLATAITTAGAFPSANPATILMYYCSRLPDADGNPELKCSGTYTTSTTNADFVDKEIAGEVTGGDPSSFVKRAKTKLITGAAPAALATFVTDAFPGLAIGDIYDFKCVRDLDVPTDINCIATYNDTVTVATYITLRSSGNIVRPISRVP